MGLTGCCRNGNEQQQGGGKDAEAAAGSSPLLVAAAIIPGAFTVAALLPDAGAGGVGGALRVPVIVPECGIGQGGANQPGVEGIIDDAVVQGGYGPKLSTICDAPAGNY